MKIILSSRKHHYLARVSTFLITLALIAGTVSCSCNGGGGDGDIVQIQNWYQLDYIREKPLGNYVLMEDLDDTKDGYDELVGETVDRKGWQPIGTKGNAFKGTFDGGGNTISDLFIYRPSKKYVGLFGYVSGGEIKNVRLVGANVTGSEAVGGLVGYNHFGSVGGNYPDELAYSTNSTGGNVAGNDNVGGLVGYNWGGIVSLCESSANVSHVSSPPDKEHLCAGGLVGRNSWGGTVCNCRYNGSVVGDKEVGGLVGLNTAFVISSYISCNVTGSNSTGGAAGRNTITGHIHNVKFEGFVNGNWTVISYMALNEGATGNAYSSDTALPGSYVGGVVGLNEGSVDNCIAAGNVTGFQYVGGLMGYSEGAVKNSCAAARVEGSLDSGGFMGKNDGTMANSFWDIEASGTTTGVGTGDTTGIIGKFTRDMKDISTYKQVGWDICAVAPGITKTDYTWNIVDGETLPFLSGKQLVQYDLTISSTVGGEVTSPGDGTFAYYEGEVINLVATPDAGYQFIEWTGDVGTIANVNAASTTITMNDNYSITANFNDVGPQVIELDFITWLPSGYFQAVGHGAWMDTIAARVLAETDDYEIRWNVFYAGTEPPGQIYSLVRDGVYDIGVTAPSFSPGIFPLWEGPQYPGDLYRNNAYTMSLTLQALYDEFTPLQNEMAAQDLKVMHFWSTGPGYFFMTEGNEVRTLADFPGKTIRVGFLEPKYTIEVLGAESLICPLSAAIEKFEAGLLHGILCPAGVPKGFGVYPYVKHCTFAPFSFQFVIIKVMNTAAWNALPAEVQTIFNEVNEVWSAYSGQLGTWGEADGLQYCYDTIPGFTYYDLREEDPDEYQSWVDATAHLVDEWIGGDATRQALWDKFVELDEYYATTPPYSTWTPGASPPPVPTFR